MIIDNNNSFFVDNIVMIARRCEMKSWTNYLDDVRKRGGRWDDLRSLSFFFCVRFENVAYL